MSGMYCGGHGEPLPCKTCAANLARRQQRDAEAAEFGKPGAIPPVPETTTGAIWENAIRKIGVFSACEWFGYPADHEFTLDTINELRNRSEEAEAEKGRS